VVFLAVILVAASHFALFGTLPVLLGFLLGLLCVALLLLLRVVLVLAHDGLLPMGEAPA
jgi:hypothetical protein